MVENPGLGYKLGAGPCGPCPASSLRASHFTLEETLTCYDTLITLTQTQGQAQGQGEGRLRPWGHFDPFDRAADQSSDGNREAWIETGLNYHQEKPTDTWTSLTSLSKIGKCSHTEFLWWNSESRRAESRFSFFLQIP